MVLQVSFLERGQSFESETVQVDSQFLVGKGGNLDDLLEFGMKLDPKTAAESMTSGKAAAVAYVQQQFPPDRRESAFGASMT